MWINNLLMLTKKHFSNENLDLVIRLAINVCALYLSLCYSIFHSIKLWKNHDLNYILNECDNLILKGWVLISNELLFWYSVQTMFFSFSGVLCCRANRWVFRVCLSATIECELKVYSHKSVLLIYELKIVR